MDLYVINYKSFHDNNEAFSNTIKNIIDGNYSQKPKIDLRDYLVDDKLKKKKSCCNKCAIMKSKRSMNCKIKKLK